MRRSGEERRAAESGRVRRKGEECGGGGTTREERGGIRMTAADSRGGGRGVGVCVCGRVWKSEEREKSTEEGG